VKLAIGADHAGYDAKTRIIAELVSRGHEVTDFGTDSTEPVDYPVVIRPVALAVAGGAADRGIVLGGSGNGEAMVANRVPGVRCALCWSLESARLARRHNDANVLALGARLIPEGELMPIVLAWLTTPFDGGRHARRVALVDAPPDGSGYSIEQGPGQVSSDNVPSWTVRRLRAGDAAAFHALRLEGFTRNPGEFRVAVEDESGLELDRVAARLESTYVAGGFDAEGLAGIAGLTRYDGAKLRHRALLWGMYLHERARGRSLADRLVEDLLAEARRQGIEQVVLTVVAANLRARRLYERWGFTVYGVEPGAVRTAGGDLDEALMLCRLR